MEEKRNQKGLSGFFQRQKFIIPPIQKKLFNSQHYQTNNINSASIKRNILFTSNKLKSLSHDKKPKIRQDVNLFKKDDRLKTQQNSINKRFSNFRHQNKSLSNNPINKFKLVQTKNQAMNWQKWTKQNINLTGQGFIANINRKIKKEVQNSQKIQKQNFQYVKLRHKIRQLRKLKEMIQNAKQNNNLIKGLKNQSNTKIKQFFNKYLKLIQEVII